MTGSDGDSREMKFMLQHLGLGMRVSYLKYSKYSDEYRFFQLCPGFVCNIICSDFVIQDVPHIATKLRTKLLKPELIPLGNYVATANDLQCLLEQRSKEKTLIRQGDLILADKMNFDAAERISKPEVRQLLHEVWKGDADGTSFYLEMMYLVTSSFLDKSLSPLERINRIWTTVFCLRYWRLWLTSDGIYSLSQNFISSNAYLSIEINAHTLLLVIRKFRLEKNPELLLTWLFGSQQCESFFRTLRALCPVGLNKPNLTEGEFLDRARKADAHLHIQQKGAENCITYRRFEQKKNRSGGSWEAKIGTSLPTDEEIAY
ncbi:hypothetical protein OUZ56_018397 [Daphnia magna]|nr:hypothetical protein OUZ56_018397 [Daphnia magna]